MFCTKSAAWSMDTHTHTHSRKLAWGALQKVAQSSVRWVSWQQGNENRRRQLTTTLHGHFLSIFFSWLALFFACFLYSSSFPFFFVRLQYAAYTQRQRAAYALFRIFRLAGPSTRSPTAAAVAGKPWKAHLLDFIGTANVFYLFFFHTAAFSFTFSQVICIIIVVSAFIVRVRVCVYVCTCESLCEFEPC